MNRFGWFQSLLLVSLIACLADRPAVAADSSKYYHSDSDARYLHHIPLYDAKNKKIGPDSTTPYSSTKTCGRCHDYETISHGWHFNAFLPDTADGREGEPWIWTDARTGTQLPLSYRDWEQTFDPREIGIDAWDLAKHFGGRIPGGGVGHAPEEEAAAEETDGGEESYSRWPLSGSLEIDCLACHGVSGSYDFNARREQIAEENFAWAATAAIRLGSIKGSVSRIKDGSDPEDESVQSKLPQVTYDASRFAADGTVFIDLVRQPENNACYQCHSNRTVGETGVDQRWTHDEDIHLRAGMQCIDCHRNGIDHHIVRGFSGEEHPSGESMVTLSCRGCHMGESGHDHDVDADPTHRGGRLGSPYPAHAGLPPLHFDKLSCTACHGGPLPREEAVGIMTSLAHSLGEKGHRTGTELPRMFGPVYAKQPDGRVYPHRVTWPAFWGSLEGDDVKPLDPVRVYDLTRPALRVRKDFATELLRPKLGSSDMKEVLGEDRYRAKEDEWTDEEAAKVDAAITAAGEALFAEKVYAALAAIEEEEDVAQAVYVSSGFVYAKGDEEDTLKKIDVKDSTAIDHLQWPMAHNVRGAGWSLGSGGCIECHSDEGKLFASTVAPEGPGPDRGAPVTMATLQGVDPNQRLTWNQLFAGRADFKYIIAASVSTLALALVFAIGMTFGRIGRRQSA